MIRRTGALLGVLLFLSILATVGVTSVAAQTSSGFAEYIILGDETNLIDAYQGMPNSGVPGTSTAANVISRVSIVSSAAGVNVYLDEVENGYSFNPANPLATADAKWDISTDNTFSNEQGPALARGQVLTLSETDTFVTGSNGIGGGDRIFISGAPVAVIRTIWPDDPGSFIAGTWELYPTVAWESDYVVPVGEDLDSGMQGGGANTPDTFLPFEYTFLFYTAEEDNTRVIVTDPTNGVVQNVVIDRGDNGAYFNVNAGTTVHAEDATTPSTRRRIQAGLITGVNENVDTRFFTLTPTAFLGNEYYLPVPSQISSGNLGTRDVDAGVYVYSFDPANVVEFQTASGTTTMTLGQGETGRFVMPRTATAGQTSGSLAARIVTQDPAKQAWVLVAYDDEDDGLDFGYQALNPEYLGTEVFLPFAPANPVYVTPVENNTTFIVDFDADGLADDTFLLNRFGYQMIYDASDNALTGARVAANGKFQAIWGQDNTQQSPGEGSPDFDFGYTILPLFWNDPQLTVDHTVSPDNLPSIGGSAVWTIVISADNNTAYNVDSAVTLPPGWEFIPGTVTITFSDATPTLTGGAANPDTGGTGPTLQWLLDHDLAAGETITITYTAQTITGTYAPAYNESLASASGTNTVDESDPNAFYFNPTDPAAVYIDPESELSLTKVSDAGGLTAPGDTITYTMVVTNIGSLNETNVQMSDPLPAGTSYVAASSELTFNVSTDVLSFVDTLPTVTYSNQSEGPDTWASSWTEVGENDGTGAGQIRVVAAGTGGTTEAIRFTGNSNARSLERFADLSGTYNVFLTFAYRRQGMEAGDNWSVEATDNAGANWTTVFTNSGTGTNDTVYVPVTLDLSSYASAQFGLRFSIDSSFNNTDDTLFLDNIALRSATAFSTYFDDFSVESYSNSFGSADWSSTPWVESDDNSVTSGDIQITSSSEGDPGTLDVSDNDRSVYRPADLTGADIAILSFDFRREGLDSAAEFVALDISSTGNSAYTEIARFTGAADDATYSAFMADITAFASANTHLRLRTNTGSLGGTEGVYFDNFLISFLDEASTPGTIPGGTPPLLFSGQTLAPGDTITVTFQVLVDNPLAPGINEILNIATVTSDQTLTPLQAEVTDVIESCVAIPSASPTDGRFLSIASANLNTLANERISFYIAAQPGTTDLELSIFDGDTGRGPAGVGDWTNGNWDYRSDELRYRLYADPDKDGNTSSGNLVGEWLGNTSNATTGTGGGSSWISDRATMPNNDWWNMTFDTSATGEATSGNFFYRLDIEFANPSSSDTWSNFKLRTNGFSISTAPNQILAFSSPLHTLQDFYVQYPNQQGVSNPGVSNYDGSWQFYVAEANPISEFTVWNGDFDAGNWAGTSVDTDDANTPNTVPGFSTSGSTVAEGAKGQGNPADNYSQVAWREIGGDIALAVVAPDNNVYTDTNPSGNGEWERFVLRTSSNGDEDQQATTLGSGAYQIRVTDLDIHNLTFLYFSNEMFTCPTTPLNRISSGVTGRVFLDRNRDGVFGTGDLALTRQPVRITGTTGRGAPVDVTVTTRDGGAFAATLVPGIYEVSVSYRLPRIQAGVGQGVSQLRTATPLSGGVVLTRRSVTVSMDDWRTEFDLAISPVVQSEETPDRAPELVRARGVSSSR
jgi:uncharacterized repeat protein (TIGR01451 family)